MVVLLAPTTCLKKEIFLNRTFYFVTFFFRMKNKKVTILALPKNFRLCDACSINELNNYCNISFTISMEMKRDKNHCLQTNYTVKKCASLLVELNNFRPRKIWERRGSGKWSRTVCKCANDDWSVRSECVYDNRRGR